MNGDGYMYKGKAFYICDPTYSGASIGQCMPNYRNVKPIVELVCGYSINYFICKPQFQHLYNIFYKRYKDNVNISIYRHLQKYLYKGLCPKLNTNFSLQT